MPRPPAPTAPRPPRRADAERNRTKILAAATELFARRGLDVSLNEVARHAGVGIATLQRNFPDRDELVTTVFVERVREYADAVDDALADTDPWTGFSGYVTRVCRMQCDDRGLATVLATPYPRSAVLEAERGRAVRGFTRLVRRAKAAGQLRPDFSPHDLPLILLANAGLVSALGLEAERASRRLVALVLQACRLTDGPQLPSGPAPGNLLRTLQRRPSG